MGMGTDAVGALRRLVRDVRVVLDAVDYSQVATLAESLRDLRATLGEAEVVLERLRRPALRAVRR